MEGGITSVRPPNQGVPHPRTGHQTCLRPTPYDMEHPHNRSPCPKADHKFCCLLPCVRHPQTCPAMDQFARSFSVGLSASVSVLASGGGGVTGVTGFRVSSKAGLTVTQFACRQTWQVCNTLGGDDTVSPCNSSSAGLSLASSCFPSTVQGAGHFLISLHCL